ncbi:MAG: MATE family efflux transporter [Polyangiaceae bacterium]
MTVRTRLENPVVDGPLAAEIARFGAPLAVGMALQNTFNLVDATLLAQLPHGEVGAAMGALGLCDQVAALGTILSYGVSTAAAAVVANRKGAGDTDGIRRVTWQSLLVVLVLGALFAVAGLFGSSFIVRTVIGAKGAVADVAVPYLRVAVGGSFAMFLLLQLTAIQRALGSSKTPVALLVSGNLLNVVLAVLLVFGPGDVPSWLAWGPPLARALGIPRMGLVGAAYATMIARLVVLVPLVLVMAKRFALPWARAGERRPDPREIVPLVRIAWPTSTQMVVRILAMLFVNALVARAFTTDTDQTASTALGVVFRLDTFALFVAMGWGSAAQTFVGQNVGAGKDDRARASGWITAVYDVVTSLILLLALRAYGAVLLGVFIDDPRAIGTALRYLGIVAPSYVALGFGVVLGNAMAGARATKTTMVVDLAVVLAFQVPVALLTLPVYGTLDALFASVAATNVVSGIAYAAVYAWGRWRRAYVEGAILTP